MSEWRVYGCGSASSSRSLQTSYEFIDGDTRLQIDFGNGALYRRCVVEGDIFKAMDSVRHLFLTHGHADHTVDLTRHVVAWKYTPAYSPGKPVHLYGTERTLELVREMLDHSVMPGMMDEAYVPQVIEMGEPIRVGDLEVRPYPTTHTEGSCGLRITTPAGLRVSFTGDTAMDGKIQEYLHDLDLLVIEASFNGTRHHMHLNLEQVGQIASETKPKALLLVHLYPEVEAMSQEEIRGILVKWYDGTILVARDGLSLKWDKTTSAWQERMML